MTPTLPSIGAAEGFLRGQRGSSFAVITSVAMRAAMIGLGLVIVGERRRVVPYAIAGALAVEAFVLSSVSSQMRK